MKISCDIIKDLLPLYHNDACNEDSKKIIEEHISECEDCKKFLEQINEDKMKIPCNIIKDLLPLYHDNVCSEDSKKIVEEHISQCNDCKKSLEQMNLELCCNDFIEKNMNDAEVMKNISKKWHNDKLLSLFKGIIITVIVLLVFYCFFGIKVL